MVVALCSGVLALSCGCQNQSAGEPLGQVPVEEQAVKGPIEPAEVELSDPKVWIDEQHNFMFDVKYRFTKGSPRQHYQLTLHFPGTTNACIKTLEAWELKQEGRIKDGIPIEGSVSKYEFTFWEADSPMNGYDRISDTLKGTYGSEPAPKPEQQAPEQQDAPAKSDKQPDANEATASSAGGEPSRQ